MRLNPRSARPTAGWRGRRGGTPRCRSPGRSRGSQASAAAAPSCERPAAPRGSWSPLCTHHPQTYQHVGCDGNWGLYCATDSASCSHIPTGIKLHFTHTRILGQGSVASARIVEYKDTLEDPGAGIFLRVCACACGSVRGPRTYALHPGVRRVLHCDSTDPHCTHNGSVVHPAVVRLEIL